MRLLNELIDLRSGDFFRIDTRDTVTNGDTIGYMRLLPRDFALPFKKGDEVYIDDFALANYQHLNAIDQLLKKEMRLSSLLENANRVGIVKSIRKNRQKRNSGKLDFVVYTIVVGFYQQGVHGDKFLFLTIKNHEFISHTGKER